MAIYLLLRPEAWDVAQRGGQYVHASLAEEGFIHTSAWPQLDRVANTYFEGADTVVLLRIDPALLQPPLRWDFAARANDWYPHIYGPLNLDAVTGQTLLHRNPNGRFELPAQEPTEFSTPATAAQRR